ncbi:MAG TPA: PqqD family peptide modification chaperone [Gammaproteobacteria bacterium]|nr:PqqD family peptide modification chaperone [Gammaproteobacteria bacterium]
MTEKVDPRPRPGVTDFELEDQLVLFDRHDRATYVLNATAAFVWRRLRQHVGLDAVVSEVARDAGISEPRARRDVDAIAAQWLAAGLIGSGSPRPQRVATDRAEISTRLSEPARRDASPELGPCNVDIRILDSHLRIEAFDRAMIEAIGEVFDGFRIEPTGNTSGGTRLLIRQMPPGWGLFEEARELARCRSRDSVVPLVHTHALMLGYLRSSGMAAVHGAALSNGKTCVLMPGSSGCGKSTLTAALVGAGFACLADDIAVLTDSPVRLRPMPVRIALKQGSWPLLSRLRAHLDALPEYALTEGSRVKYLSPAGVRAQSLSQFPVEMSSLVFPRYVSGPKNELRRISKGDTFGKLFAAGHDLKGPFSESRVRTVTDWLRETPCFELEFSDLDAATGRIAELLS